MTTDASRAGAEVPTLDHAGRLTPAPGVAAARAGGVDRGTVVEISLQVEAGIVVTARFLAFGDAETLTCAEAACREIEGLAVEAARALTGLEVAAIAGVDEASTGRALTVEDALKSALAGFPSAAESRRGSEPS